MKITEQEIKNMILSELNDLVSTQDDVYGAQRQFEISPFSNYANAIRQNAERMVKVLESSDDYDRRALVDFKDRVIPDLHLAISQVENKINALLSKK